MGFPISAIIVCFYRGGGGGLRKRFGVPFHRILWLFSWFEYLFGGKKHRAMFSCYRDAFFVGVGSKEVVVFRAILEDPAVYVIGIFGVPMWSSYQYFLCIGRWYFCVLCFHLLVGVLSIHGAVVLHSLLHTSRVVAYKAGPFVRPLVATALFFHEFSFFACCIPPPPSPPPLDP